MTYNPRLPAGIRNGMRGDDTDDQTWAETLAQGAVSGGTSPQISDTDDLVPVTDGVPSIGTAAKRFAEGYLNIVYAGGASSGSHADGDDVIVGTIAATNRGVTVVTGTGATGGFYFSDTAGSRTGGILYAHASPLMHFRVEDTNRVSIGTASAGPTSTNSMQCGTSATGWQAIWLYERAAQIAGAAAHGSIWLRSDTPNTLMFTDDAGSDWQIGGTTITATNGVFGSGSGDPHVTIAKGAATDNDALYLAAGGTAAANRTWAVNHDASENLSFNRWSGGAEVDSPLSIAYATGDVTALANLNVSTGDLDVQAGQAKALGGLVPGNGAAYGPTIHAGSGAPGAGLGADGDFYFRSDGVVASSPVIYHKESGSWVTVI